MANQSDNRRSRFVAFRLPRDLAEVLEAQQQPGQPFAYLVVQAIKEGIASRAPAPAITPAHEQGTDVNPA